MKRQYRGFTRIWLTADNLAYAGIAVCYVYAISHAFRFFK